MMLWMILALMTGAAVLTVLWPLSATVAAAGAEPAGDVDFYAAQLAEIDRDRDRGLIGGAEAEGARIESSRRLLRASATPSRTVDVTSEPALRRRRAASALALSVVPIVGLALYGVLGSPQLSGQLASSQQASGQPASGREAAASAPAGFAAALRQVEEHLAANPDDQRGWEIVGPIYLRLGRFAEADRAFKRSRALGGDTTDRLNGEGEALVGLAEGRVGPEARALFRLAVARDPASASARYHLALAAEQDGDAAAAITAYRELIEAGPADAPWQPLVRARLARLGGAAPAPRLASDAVTPEIAAMVAGLDDRLTTGGGSPQEWLRLIRSLAVLGRSEDALDRLRRARIVVAGDPEAGRQLDELAAELGLREVTAQP